MEIISLTISTIVVETRAFLQHCFITPSEFRQILSDVAWSPVYALDTYATIKRSTLSKISLKCERVFYQGSDVRLVEKFCNILVSFVKFSIGSNSLK